MTVTCVSCFTTGNAALLTTGFAIDTNLVTDVIAATEEFIKNPKGFIEQAVAVTFEVDFQDLAGHFEFDISFASAGTFTFPLFHPITPLGANVSNPLLLSFTKLKLKMLQG